MGEEPQAAPVRAPATSGLAIASFVLGIVGLTLCTIGPLAGIPALILGVVALGKIGESGGRLGGRGLAIAGVVTGAISPIFLVSCVMAGLLLPAFARAREFARREACRGNLKQLGLACRVYAADNDESFPDKLSQLYPEYASDLALFACPAAEDTVACAGDIDPNSSYVLVSGLKSTGPPKGVLVHDKLDNHFDDGANVLSVDGEVEWMKRTDLEMLFTEPEVGF